MFSESNNFLDGNVSMAVLNQVVYDMDVSENSGIPKSSILIGFSIINQMEAILIHFEVPLFLETPICFFCKKDTCIWTNCSIDRSPKSLKKILCQSPGVVYYPTLGR